MALNDTVLSLITFKNLLGKAMTDQSKGINNEAETYNIINNSDFIFIDEIDSDPQVTVNNGFAEFITADLVEDNTSNGHAYFAQYQGGHPNAGQRVKNAINTKFGLNYEAVVRDVNTDRIFITDPREWIYQYQPGIFYQQNVQNPNPSEIDLYVYIGRTLTDFLEAIRLNNEVDQTALQTSSDGDQALSSGLQNNPIDESYIDVRVNNLPVTVGDGIKTKPCYFSSDGGSTAKPFTDIVQGDILYWNGSIAGYELDTTDTISIIYLING